MLGQAKKKNHEAELPPPPVVYADGSTGLTSAQCAERIAAGCVNTPPEPPGKSVRQIILGNIFTYFNIVFFVLAGFIIAVGSWNNLMFMGVVLVNMVIGIVQELRSKKTLDNLTLLNSSRATVVRDGARMELDPTELVRDDIVVFSMGDQIYADAEVVSGQCQVNEALITGESDEIRKNPGDTLTSGSFLVSGSCLARLTAVGKDSYVNRMTTQARKSGKKKRTGMMRSLDNLIKGIGILIVPLGLLLGYKEIHWVGRSFQESVVSTVAALVGMIPEGLYLLTTLALTASILRLARQRTLVHEMGCIETLARVDTLCVDKTGTITENKMIVEDIVPLWEDQYPSDAIRSLMSDYVYAMKDDNDTMAALRRYFTDQCRRQAADVLPFTSVKKYGGVCFSPDETYLLGAPEVLLETDFAAYRDLIEGFSAKGCRVLLLGRYGGSLSDERLTARVTPVALILLSNKIRPEAPDTFHYFADQGVKVKVISGDNPLTVSEVSKRAGIEGAESWVDARTLTTDKQIYDAVETYTVFGRVTPEQKRKLVKALKLRGHTVAMTGDGVNDVLALKEADCSVAMASGSDVACRVSHIVLLESNFAVMPEVVAEGRRVINNIERSATLFLVKNIFSFCLALVSLIFTLPYPFTAAQLSLVSMLTIGIPGFILAMEPNTSLVKGKFLPNVLRQAAPPALTDFLLIVGVLLFYIAFSLEQEMMSTICATVMGIVGLLVIWRICKPMTPIRKALCIGITGAFAFCTLFMKDLFTLSPLDFSGMLLLIVFALLAGPALNVAYKTEEWIIGQLRARREGRSLSGRWLLRKAGAEVVTLSEQAGALSHSLGSFLTGSAQKLRTRMGKEDSDGNASEDGDTVRSNEP